MINLSEGTRVTIEVRSLKGRRDEQRYNNKDSSTIIPKKCRNRRTGSRRTYSSYASRLQDTSIASLETQEIDVGLYESNF